MPEFGLRDFGTFVPGSRSSEPEAVDGPPLPRDETNLLEPRDSAVSVFSADNPDAPDVLGVSGPLALLAALASHAATETPLAIGLLGRSGSGKSLALRILVRAIESPGGSSGGALGTCLVARIDAARLDGPAIVALADALHARLAESFPALLAEAGHASRDPRQAARAAFEALDGARQKLVAERLALDDSEARRARLAETVLFETAGTQIDAFARANRRRLKNRFAGLGLKDDPVLALKEMARLSLDGAGAKAAFVLRSFWGFKGQATLIVIAVLLLASGIGLGIADREQAAWLGWLRSNESTRAAADWFAANSGLAEGLRQIAFAGAALAVSANALRALRLLLPVFRASALLKSDLELRRRETEGQFGHQMRRVESLTADVDALARRAAEAERRAADARAVPGSSAEPSPFLDDPRKRHADRFIAAVGALITRKDWSRSDANGVSVERPDRIVVALDGLESVPLSRVRDILGAAHAAFGPGFVMLVAVDPYRLRALSDGGENGLDTWIQVPFQVGEVPGRGDLGALVRAILDPSKAGTAPEPGRNDSPFRLDEPIPEVEAALLTELAPLAGGSARAIKRFVNLYRLARIQCPDHKGMLALLLALDAGGTEAEITAVSQALAATEAHLDVDPLRGGPRLAAALAAVRSHSGDETLAGARRAAEWARLFSFHPHG